MKNLIKISVVLSAFVLICGSVNAQWGIGEAVRRGVERGVESAVEKEAEKQATKSVEKGVEKAERANAEAQASLEEVENAMEANEEAAAPLPDVEIPEVAGTPYTPSEGEYAFFAMRKGNVQTFATKDNKGKITGQTRNTITGIVGNKDAFAIDYRSEILDEKGKSMEDANGNPLAVNLRIVVKDGTAYLDLKGMFAAMPGLEEVQASGTAMKIPGNLSVGQTLPNASAKVKIGFINCTAEMTEGKVLARESVSTAAGTFDCYKVSQKTNATAMGIKTEGTTNTWYAKGIGTVKTETLDKNGKVIQTQELISNVE